MLHNICLVTLFASLLSSTHAAEITWSKTDLPVTGGEGESLSSGVLKKDGPLIIAQNLGGVETAYDGITFSEGQINFGEIWEAYHAKGEALSGTGTWNDDPIPSKVTLTKLSLGRTYRIQALIYDGRDSPSIIGKTVSFDGQNMGCYAHAINGVTWGKGLVVIGTFVADAPTQTFSVETFIPSSGSVGGQLNALLLHEIDNMDKSKRSSNQVAEIQQNSEDSKTSALIQIGGIAVHLSP